MIGGSEILGQVAPREQLTRMLESRRVPHALLFRGPEGVGKGTVATALAAALLCAERTPRACGACESCRLVASGAHPDLLFTRRLTSKKRASAAADAETDDEVVEGDGPAEPEAAPAAAGKLAAVISVDQVRELCRLVAQASRLGRGRVFVVDPADRMNPAAQSALLKTLEEPPAGVVIVLLAARPFLLLPTVRSRCFPVRFAPLRTRELAALLEQRGMDTGEALRRASLAEGRPGFAMTLDPEPLAAARDQLLAGLERLAASDAGVGELAPLAAALAGKDEDELIAGLELFEALARDAARAALDPRDEALVHADVAPRLSALGRRVGVGRLAAIVESTERQRRDLVFHLNRPLVAESLLAAIAGGPIP